MAKRTLLQIINQAQQELGLPVSSTVIGNTDNTTVQLLALAQYEVEELNQRYNWTLLHNEYNLAIAPPTSATGDFTSNSTIITNMSSTSGLEANYYTITSTGVPIAARIVSVDSATQVTMSMEYVGDNVVGQDIVFSKDTYPEPADFSRFENRTWWDRTNRWELLGPDSPQMDQWHRSGIVVTGPRRHFRQIGYFANSYRIWPPPTELVEPAQLVFEYISNYNVYTGGQSSGLYSSNWTLDTDTPILDDRAIVMGIKWRFWEQKGMNSAMKRADYNSYVDRLVARDGGRETLSLVNRVHPIFISPANVQDGFFPGPTGPNTG